MKPWLSAPIIAAALVVASSRFALGYLIADGTYEIAAQNSDLPISAAGVAEGSAVTQEHYVGLQTQRWTVTNLGGNVVKILVVGTGEALEDPGSSTTEGMDLDVSTYAGTSNQKWTIVAVEAGYYEIVNVSSGQEINVSGASIIAGASIIQWDAGDYANGVCAFTPVAAGIEGANGAEFNLQTLASGANSTALNDNTIAGAYDSLALGRFNVGNYGSGGDTSWIATDPLLEVGNGTDADHPADAFVLYKNGNAQVHGTFRCAPGGDISMGSFTSGAAP